MPTNVIMPALELAQESGKVHHLHGSPGEARRGGPGAAPGRERSWKDGAIVRHAEVNIGLAVAIDDGLIVPVIHRADTLSLAEIATRREDMVSRGQAGKLRPTDIQGGGFTISSSRHHPRPLHLEFLA